MSRMVTVAISELAASRAQELAQRTDRRPEESLAQWIDQAAAEPPVASLSDEEVRTLCAGQMDERSQRELGALLAQQREGMLDSAGRERLDQFMHS